MDGSKGRNISKKRWIKDWTFTKVKDELEVRVSVWGRGKITRWEYASHLSIIKVVDVLKRLGHLFRQRTVKEIERGE